VCADPTVDEGWPKNEHFTKFLISDSNSLKQHLSAKAKAVTKLSANCKKKLPYDELT